VRGALDARAHQGDEVDIQQLDDANDLAVLQAAPLRAFDHLLPQMFNEVRRLSFF